MSVWGIGKGHSQLRVAFPTPKRQSTGFYFGSYLTESMVSLLLPQGHIGSLDRQGSMGSGGQLNTRAYRSSTYCKSRLGRLRQQDWKFKASLGNLDMVLKLGQPLRPCVKMKRAGGGVRWQCAYLARARPSLSSPRSALTKRMRV